VNPRAEKGVNIGVAPVTYGEGERPPRGDYARARSDYTCEQDHAQYGAADHDTYRRLYARQLAQIGRYACREFVDAVKQLGAPDHIPRFDDINQRLTKATGWQSSTTWSSPTSFTTCSVMCRCCSTRPLPTTCRPMAPVA
jgi:hypothetical protein